jgi:uncharacterized protein
METQQVDPATIAVWRWQGLIATAIATAASLLPLVAVGVPAGAIVIVLLGLTLTWLLPPAQYRHLRYSVDPTGIGIERGVFWQSYAALPRSRIQHSDVSQGPLQRRYGVATLKLYTAGSRYTKIELPGLTHDNALALRDALLAGNSASGV